MCKCAKSAVIIFLSAVMFLGAQRPVNGQENDVANQELIQKSSYIIGYNIVKDILSNDIELDKTTFLKGAQNAMEGVPSGMDDEEIETILLAFQKLTEKRQFDKIKQSAEINRTEGEALLAKNAARQGVKKLDNGVQYEVLKEGAGAKPIPGANVKIHYHGMLADGTVFDSSVERNQPVVYPVDQFVAGFSSALQAMKEGDKWRVVIPSDLAYGVQGPPGIGPNRTLIFELELISIEK